MKKFKFTNHNRKIVNDYFDAASRMEIHQRRKLIEKIIKRMLPELYDGMRGRKKHK